MSAAPFHTRRSGLDPVIARSVLGLVFIGAGALKIAHPLTFHALVLAYSIPAPEAYSRALALFLPWLEAVAGVLLLVDVWTPTVLPVVTVLALVFVGALGQAVLRGLDLSCGCFGGTGPAWLEQPLLSLARAVILLGFSVWLLRVRATPKPQPLIA